MSFILWTSQQDAAPASGEPPVQRWRCSLTVTLNTVAAAGPGEPDALGAPVRSPGPSQGQLCLRSPLCPLAAWVQNKSHSHRSPQITHFQGRRGGEGSKGLVLRPLHRSGTRTWLAPLPAGFLAGPRPSVEAEEAGETESELGIPERGIARKRLPSWGPGRGHPHSAPASILSLQVQLYIVAIPVHQPPILPGPVSPHGGVQAWSFSVGVWDAHSASRVSGLEKDERTFGLLWV